MVRPEVSKTNIIRCYLLVGSRRHDHTSANAQKSYHSYLALAREAASRGDTIAAENFYQHAEHFLRLLKEPTS